MKEMKTLLSRLRIFEVKNSVAWCKRVARRLTSRKRLKTKTNIISDVLHTSEVVRLL